MRGVLDGLRGRLAGDVRPVSGTVVGLAGVAALELLLSLLHRDLARATVALALVVPVIAAAVLGGRWAAYVVAAAAAVAFALLIPPVGSLRVEVAQDVVALAVFGLVALAVGALVAHRVEALGRVEHQRQVLLRSVSHDLRTPLAAILASSTELADAPHDEPTRQALLGLITSEAERLDRLVANLLSMSRVEAGVLVADRQAVDLGELATRCAERLGRRLTDVEVTVDAAADLPVLQLDHTLFEQVVVNLVENAARHSPAGGTVRVEVSAPGRVVRLVVSDEGPGVDPGERAAVFEPFWSGAAAGIGGIGLAICRAVVDLHGGTISVGESPSGGAAFAVELPA